MATAAVMDFHPEELEQGQDTPIRESIFTSGDHRDEAIADLGAWIESELNRSMGARRDIETVWEDNLRQYEGVSAHGIKNVPIENASNLEITLGATAVEGIYAQIINLIFQVDPLVTVREVGATGRWKEHVKALQRFVDVLSKSKLGLREAAENAILDNVKLGTGILYTRWQERTKKTQVETVTQRGPVVRSVPLEDFFVPGGAYSDLQDERWVAFRQWLTQNQMNQRERDLGWDIEGAIPSGILDRTRQTRERLGRHDGMSQHTAAGESDNNQLFQVFTFWALYDLDGDGILEDILVTYDFGSRKVMKWSFNPYDRRPFTAMRYQLREHLFYGMGVIEMIRPYQMGATNLYNNWVDNSQLANTRFWAGKHGSVPNNQLRIWPNRFLPLANPREDLIPHVMADTYPSAPMALQTTMSLASKRVGVDDLGNPQSRGGVLGNRTPGITALSLLQRSNERFGPAFDAARRAVSGAVKQALYRYQERLLMGDEVVIQELTTMFGIEDATLLTEVMTSPTFDDSMAVELTASSAQVNRESDRQNWILLFQQVFTFGERIIQLVQLIESPEAGPLLKDTAQQLVDLGNEIMSRTMRTFDQVRDPTSFLIELNQELVQADESVDQNQLAALGSALAQQFGGQNGAAGGADVGAANF